MSEAGTPALVQDRAPARATVLTLAAVVSAVAGWLTVQHLGAMEALGAASIPWGALVALCFLTEVFLVHFEHRRESHSVSFSAIPLVIGFYAVSPMMLLASRLAGSALALGAYRRQPLEKLAVNLSSFWLETAVAVSVFRIIVPEGGGVGPRTWLAAFAGAVAGDLVQALVVTVAISLYQRRLEVLSAPALLGPVVSIINTCLALVAVTVLAYEPAALALLAGVVPMLFVSYRTHARLRERHRDLERLYEFTRRVGESILSDKVVVNVLEQVKELMHADAAWLCVDASEDDGDVLRVRANRAGGTTSMGMPRGSADHSIHVLAQSDTRPVLVDAGSTHPMAGPLGSLGLHQALVAALPNFSGARATVIVADRSGDVRPFGRNDLQLFATLVNHASAALENSHLLEELRRQADASEHQSLHDALTGLPNRIEFGDRVAAAIRSRLPVAVLLIDLDHFKEVNDTLGHGNGDLLLQEVGVRLSEALRSGDTVARLGGDEFAVLLPDITSGATAHSVAESLRAALARPFSVAGVDVSVDASVGIALAPDHGRDAAGLLQRADVAMYTAKTDRSGIETYSPDRDQYSPDRLALVGELRRAIDEQQLAVHYQPQIDLDSGRVVGVEALIRWPGQEAAISPAELVTLCEHTGLIHPLTTFVLRTAAAQAARWRASGWDLRMSVNLSARSLLNPELLIEVRGILDRAGLPATALCLELTETSIMSDPVRSVPMLERLHDAGIRIAVDDFGVGYSSLNYLRQLPVDEIKIDKSFVMDMAGSESDEAIVRSVIDLAANMGLPVVAEGVETAGVSDRLRELGCTIAQGYFYSRPAPAEDLTAWLTGMMSAPLPLR